MTIKVINHSTTQIEYVHKQTVHRFNVGCRSEIVASFTSCSLKAECVSSSEKSPGITFTDENEEKRDEQNTAAYVYITFEV